VVTPGVDAATARRIAGAVTDPELPMITLAELGILRDVRVEPGGAVVVTLAPTYLGCPALQAMSQAVQAVLEEAGAGRVTVRTVLKPRWSTDDISAEGREKLAAAGVAPPGPAAGPVSVSLEVPCPRCAGRQTEELARFGPTPCTALRRCPRCGEPFQAVKPL
jgi:ring-1,2-phenylacetyl-CoA epoxidase subunit PaaD